MIPFVLGYNLFLGMNAENYDKKIIIHSLLGKADKKQENECPVLLFPAESHRGDLTNLL